MSTRYQVLPPTAPVPAPDDVLEQLVRAGARKMLQDALEAEVDDFLGRRRYQRTEDKRGNRNGHLPERTIGVGMGAVEVRLPRVSDVPSHVSPDGFHSEIVSRYQRRSCVERAKTNGQLGASRTGISDEVVHGFPRKPNADFG